MYIQDHIKNRHLEMDLGVQRKIKPKAEKNITIPILKISLTFGMRLKYLCLNKTSLYNKVLVSVQFYATLSHHRFKESP